MGLVVSIGRSMARSGPSPAGTPSVAPVDLPDAPGGQQSPIPGVVALTALPARRATTSASCPESRIMFWIDGYGRGGEGTRRHGREQGIHLRGEG
jgi:hypothetical protein